MNWGSSFLLKTSSTCFEQDVFRIRLTLAFSLQIGYMMSLYQTRYVLTTVYMRLLDMSLYQTSCVLTTVCMFSFKSRPSIILGTCKAHVSMLCNYSCVFGKRNYRVLVRVSVCVCVRVCVCVCVCVCVFAR